MLYEVALHVFDFSFGLNFFSFGTLDTISLLALLFLRPDRLELLLKVSDLGLQGLDSRAGVRLAAVAALKVPQTEPRLLCKHQKCINKKNSLQEKSTRSEKLELVVM